MNQDTLDERSLLVYAQAAGFREIDARAGLDGSTSAKVEGDMASGDRSGVQGTPSFFINGQRHNGDWSEESLRRALRQAANGRSVVA